MTEPVDRYRRYMTGPSEGSLDRAVRDLRGIIRGRQRVDGGADRYTEAGLSRSHYDQLRHQRDDLDYREWNADTGFSGVTRQPDGPGMAAQAGAITPADMRRRLRRLELEDGF